MRCDQFGDVLSRRVEHLDDEILRSLHPLGTWIGHVGTGRFPAEQGIEHTFDRFENVFPNLAVQWEDVTAAACVGKPCDPSALQIGMGFTRDSYRLQRTSYETALFCWDQILSADRAKQQFAHMVKTLRRASSIINSHRFRTEALRIAKFKWALSNVTGTGFVPLTVAWDTSGTYLTVSSLPTSKLTARHLQRRVTPQKLLGAMGQDIILPDGKTSWGAQPLLEFVTDDESIWSAIEGDTNLTDHWRYSDFGNEGQKYYKYGWLNRLGDYGLRADSMPLRFNVVQQNADGSYKLQLVFPYTNVSATEGIKEALNDAWENAPIQADFIWHRMAMISLVRDTTSINPEMPFAMRDFAGKWQFVMDNLTCGVDVNNNPIAVDNSRRNKGKFISDFSYATKAEYPEFAELFLTLREQACVVDVPRCQVDPGYPTQMYDSGNAPCPTSAIVLTITPVLNSATHSYEIPANAISCNGMPIFHDAVTGTLTLAALVAQLNALVPEMGAWAVSGSNITLTGAACSTVNMPWTIS